MNAPQGTADDVIPSSWSDPPRAGVYRLINPWEYRHLRFSGGVRVVGGSVAAAAGAVCLSNGIYGWAALFLGIAALNLAGGSWYLTIALTRR